jgi:4-aminobutyrate aminotransferase / (S)-3-amino-2-methylpropionate transaminase / 5-aminovalerate transaminase
MASIVLRTAIPGPKAQELAQRRAQAVPRGIYASTPIYVSRAEGALLEDVDGNTFIDLAGGIGVINAGHRSPTVVDAIHRQADRYLHTCFQVIGYESYIKLAERLNEITPGDFPKRTFFVNSGAEAVENAVKIARFYTKRPAVICFEDAFHGRTLLGMALTSKTHPYKAGFEPFPSDIYRIPLPSRDESCSDILDRTFKRTVAAESVAAIIVEPIQGEGGFITPPSDFLHTLHGICKHHGIVLIADEVQTGFGRTGAMFACERYAVEPDILIAAKSLGAGLPIGSITGRAEIMDAPGPGGIGGTFGGNPVACEAALATIDTMLRLDLPARANALGERFHARATKWQSQWPQIQEVRGLGAMQAMEFVRTPESSDAVTKHIIQYCYERGVIILNAGSYGNVIRLLMPLVITDAQFDEALDVLEAALAHELAAQQVTTGASHS